MTFTLADDAALLQPITIGSSTARNRLFMAPLTRSRAQADGTPSDLQVEYYAQRASAGLIITEATAISQVGNGAYVNTPGIYTDRHQEKWAEVASAVHARDGLMFMQIWHVGRMAHPDINGAESVAPSPIAADLLAHTPSGKKPLPVPRALGSDEIPGVVAQFRAAARRAVDAGLDGVEIHSANGYLLHQFLSDTANTRTDRYGGSAQNRARLTAEVVEAVADEIGAGRVGLRISPGNGAGGVNEIDAVSAYEALLHRISPLELAYLHVLINPDAAEFGVVRALWPGPFVLNTGRDIDTSFCQLENLVDWGVISAAAVGRAYLANPDLIDRLRTGAELTAPDVATFYSPGAAGYVDYPTLAPTV
ncbi:alkene reductase [Mycolicibacterium helvum]|uniref:Putative NADH-dependent flavin oxidoreductase n=1 Tax=Mycolicibacterium helvum TaxID=1534349 RepID=A0A7I7T674_9MYCO|nr:alkene reductase [Mycolicibacterium helvum]BBY64767.1 putative NADH-dependent flavin oxidoreductase [Mycolicibacterium helvum]